MIELVLATDAVLAMPGADVTAAVKLAELAGVDAIRVPPRDDLAPVRRAARRLELRMEANAAHLKCALELQPDRVAVEGPLDPSIAGPVLRGLADARIPVSAIVAPELEAVKTAHAAGLERLELATDRIVDVPEEDRGPLLEQLTDAGRLAAKLRMPVALAGGLDRRNLPGLLSRVPTAGRVVAGDAVWAEAVLVGLDRAVRDLRAGLR